jgi:hypothetical protein
LLNFVGKITLYALCKAQSRTIEFLTHTFSLGHAELEKQQLLEFLPKLLTVKIQSMGMRAIRVRVA